MIWLYLSPRGKVKGLVDDDFVDAFIEDYEVTEIDDVLYVKTIFAVFQPLGEEQMKLF